MSTPPIPSDRFARREAAAIRKYLKPRGLGFVGEVGRRRRLHLNHVNGDLWWSDAYIALPVGAGMTRLLGLANLPLEPMVCDLTDGITRTDSAPGDLQANLDKHAPTKGKAKPVPVWPLTYGGVAITLTGANRTLELWTADGENVDMVIDAELRRMVARGAGDPIWRRQPGPLNAAVRYDQAGQPVGLAMAVRLEAGPSESVLFADKAAA